MAGSNTMVTGLLVAAVLGALVYLVDPTFFGLFRLTQGFGGGPGVGGMKQCPAGVRVPVDAECFSDMNAKKCPVGQVMINGQCVDTFTGGSPSESQPSTGSALPGQMANPGATNLANEMGNQHAAGSNLGTSAFPPPSNNDGFADIGSEEGPANFGSSQQPAGCYPRDQLTPSELLPKDQNSVWAEQNPMGPGSLKGKNFLSAGALIGVNTVGQSLRNANWQLRSEPPNPQVPISIFNQSTIQPDVNRRPLEIN